MKSSASFAYGHAAPSAYLSGYLNAALKRLFYTCQIVTDDISRQRFTPQTVRDVLLRVKPGDKATLSCLSVLSF